jgi:hypothetical protein
MHPPGLNGVLLLLLPLSMRLFAAGLEPIGTQAVDPNQWLRTCVPPFKNQGFPDHQGFPYGINPNPYIAYSNYDLISQPGGLCADFMSCAFVNCSWSAAAKQALMSSDLTTVDIKTLLPQLPPLNLPAFINFPQSVKDVVDALASNAAGKKLRVSIKTSGHSYSGSSTVGESLQLNLRSFPKYSATSITSCLSPPARESNPCKLALERGKKGTVRVGGGEKWGDVYLAVLANNRRTGSQKYNVLGGGAGSVGSAGGWLHGGGLSVGMERMYGFGVDQVLELEMVLADGTHVKFGPTGWETVPSLLYPRTTKVEGQCNANVVADEAAWQWAACENSIPFDDLWFAVRGGGGGSYGIVTAVLYQLHDFKPMYYITANLAPISKQCKEAPLQCNCSEFDDLWYDFLVDLFFAPEGIGLSISASNSCGSAAAIFDPGRFNYFMCWGDDETKQVLAAWRTYAQSKVIPKFPSLSKGDLLNLFEANNENSYEELLLNNPQPRVPSGSVPDNPPPSTVNDAPDCWSANIPIGFLRQKRSEATRTFLRAFNLAHVMGGWTSKAHDNMTSIHPLQRDSGFQAQICVDEFKSYMLREFQPFYGPRSEGKYPGGHSEYNHVSARSPGPLKSDFATACPSDLSSAEQAAQCVSVQEAVWGTDLLARLTSIKAAVDPMHVFYCPYCVGANVSVATSPAAITQPPTVYPSTAPGPTSAVARTCDILKAGGVVVRPPSFMLAAVITGTILFAYHQRP